MDAEIDGKLNAFCVESNKVMSDIDVPRFVRIVRHTVRQREGTLEWLTLVIANFEQYTVHVYAAPLTQNLAEGIVTALENVMQQGWPPGEREEVFKAHLYDYTIFTDLWR